MSSIEKISPIDGRYYSKTKALSEYFSEYALIKYRLFVEVQYLIALKKLGLKELSNLTDSDLENLQLVYKSFNKGDSNRVKEIESVTNHDVKAVEYYLKDKMKSLGMSKSLEFVHFGLTSQDINNTAFPLMIRKALDNVIMVELKELITTIKNKSKEWKDISMLARTHGQPASPTTLGKELYVFVDRLENQLKVINDISLRVKFGGATGNFNAHLVAYPEINWYDFANKFTKNYLGLERSSYTTQIDHYDSLSELFDAFARVNTILIDFSRDIWSYISMDYFKQKLVKNEVGSSAMPHKVNPIDFENAEGNLGMSNSVFKFLSSKLPISRLQRDLTDSTVLRNVGVPFAHLLISIQSLQKGISKLVLNEEKINSDLEANWAVVSEAIQNILRKISYPQPYEALKQLTRGNADINKATIHDFIDSLDIDDVLKSKMKKITPFNYIGYKIKG